MVSLEAKKMEQLILPVRINPFWAERFTVVARVGDEDFKLFQVLFTAKNGSVFVSFPYFPDSRGIAAVATLDPDARLSGTVDLRSQGKLTSHLVKYHHPPDGRAHCSQDGKIRTELMKQSVPHRDLDGHMFSVYMKGITHFSRPDRPVESSAYAAPPQVAHVMVVDPCAARDRPAAVGVSATKDAPATPAPIRRSTSRRLSDCAPMP